MRYPRFSTPILAVPKIACCCMFGLIVFAIFGPAFRSVYYVADNRTCMGNLKVVSISTLQYAQDWDETYPPAEHWADSAAKHILPADVPGAFHCPSANTQYGYVYDV